ncbi:MAG: hypothetical protein HY904_24580 [Deltaproteobacteria bacterium]|nr:hypothetical protein [Deltaproteobacteria bacterium]
MEPFRLAALGFHYPPGLAAGTPRTMDELLAAFPSACPAEEDLGGLRRRLRLFNTDTMTLLAEGEVMSAAGGGVAWAAITDPPVLTGSATYLVTISMFGSAGCLDIPMCSSADSAALAPVATSAGARRSSGRDVVPADYLGEYAIGLDFIFQRSPGLNNVTVTDVTATEATVHVDMDPRGAPTRVDATISVQGQADRRVTVAAAETGVGVRTVTGALTGLLPGTEHGVAIHVENAISGASTEGPTWFTTAPLPDAGPLDAGVAADAAQSVDAGPPTDAAHPIDAAQPTDAAQAMDAAQPADAAQPTDASLPIDAAHVVDGGGMSQDGAVSAPDAGGGADGAGAKPCACDASSSASVSSQALAVLLVATWVTRRRGR